MADKTTKGLQLRFSTPVKWYRFDGPAGDTVDAFVAVLTNAGLLVEVISPGTAYRLRDVPPAELLPGLVQQIEQIPGLSIAVEAPPEDRVEISSRQTQAPQYPRTLIVHGGTSAFSHVARAIDRRLIVSSAGITRWAISGPTSALMAWLAEVKGWALEEALKLHGLTAEQVGAEDAGTPPVNVTVNLPPRRTTSDITRDPRTGDITQVVQLERDA